jgi:hypothetical protein
MKRVVVVHGDTIGVGSDELGAKQMGSFLRKLQANPDKPDAMIFYNSGVKLLSEGSSVLDAMDALFRAGVDLIACATCVGYYGLGDKMTTGRIGDMQEVVSILMSAGVVVTV